VGARHGSLAYSPSTTHPSGDLAHGAAGDAASVVPGGLDQEPANQRHAVSLQMPVILGLPGLVGRGCESFVRAQLVHTRESFDGAEERGDRERDELADPGNRAEQLGRFPEAPGGVDRFIELLAGQLEIGEGLQASIDLVEMELPEDLALPAAVQELIFVFNAPTEEDTGDMILDGGCLSSVEDPFANEVPEGSYLGGRSVGLGNGVQSEEGRERLRVELVSFPARLRDQAGPMGSELSMNMYIFILV
jgi:hypothetical protein